MEIYLEEQDGYLIDSPDNASDTLDFSHISFASSDKTSIQFEIEPLEAVKNVLTCYVISQSAGMYAQTIKIPLKPLCQHYKISAVPGTAKSNKMTVTGTFSASQLNTWLYQILPDLQPVIEDDVT